MSEKSCNTHYVALYGGFLVVEKQNNSFDRVYTIADIREATSFNSFEEADSAGSSAARKMYPDDIRYYAVLEPSSVKFN